MAKWLSKYEQGGLVLKKKTKDNYDLKANPNDVQASVGPGYVGLGYNTKGRNYSPAWGGQFQNGGFLQPTSSKLPEGYVIPYNTPSTELAMSIGGEKGEPAYLIPSFKGGKKLKDPIAEFKKTGEHLGGPFKTWQEAEKFGEMRHQYVEKGQDIPTPLKTWGDMAMGGSLPGAVGFTYARTAGAAPSNGKYAKKTKASAQNGEALPPPRYNAQGKRYLYDTADPAFKDIVEGDIIPASKSEFNPIRNTISDYVLSDTFLNRLNNFVSDKRFARRIQLARAHQMLNTNIKSINEYVKGKGGDDSMPNTSRYDRKTNTIYFTPGEDSRATFAHEVGHSLFNSSTDEKNTNSALFLNQAERQAILGNLNVEGLNKLINSDPNLDWMAQDEHYSPMKGEKIAANETYGDLLSLRLILNDNGVTKKFGDNLTPEMWEKALKNPKINKAPDIKRMRLKYTDKDLIEMNNKVAKNDAVIPNPNVEELIPIAQDGRRVNAIRKDVYDPARPDWSRHMDGLDPKAAKERLELAPKWKQFHDDSISMSQSDWVNKYIVGLEDNRETRKLLKERYKEWKDYRAYTEGELLGTKNDLDDYYKWEKSKQQYFEGLAAQQKKIDEERAGKQKFIGDYSSKQKALKELENTFATKYGYVPGEKIGGDAHKMLVKKMIDEANQAIESGIGYNLFQDPKSEMTCINGVCTIAANAGVDFSKMANALGVVKDPEGRYIPQSNIGWAQNDAYKKAGFRKLAPGELPQEGDFAQYGDAGRLHHMELILGASPEGITTFNNYGQTLNPVPGAGREQRNFRKGSLNAEDFETTQYFRLDPKTEEAIMAKSPEYTKKAEAKKKAEASDEYKQYLEYQKFLEGNKGQFEEYQKALQQKQNGGEMSFYQQGLDFTPKTISKNGSVIKDDRGQWAHPGKITEIGSNNITMQGVDYPVLGISDTGDVKLMQPGENYKFEGKKVTEFPMMQKGGWLNKYTPKAQTGITTSIGSGTTNPTVKLTTQEDIKKAKKKAEADAKEAFAAAAKRDRKNQAYISKDRSTPASRAADQQMLTDAYMAEAQRNSPLAQTFASWAPGGTDVGTVQASQFSKTLPIVAGGAAGMAVLPEVLAGLAANMGGIPGLTGNNIINALFAYEAAKNIPNVGSSISNAYGNPTWGNVGDATAETVLTGLNVLPFATEAIKGAKSLNKLRNIVNASKETPVINNMGEIINAAPIEESGSRHLYNPVTGQTLQYDASGNVISSSKKLTDAEIRAHNRNMVGTFKTGYTPPPSEGMSPYLNSEIDWGAWNSEIPKNHKLMKEYSAIEQQAKANGTWMKNADGTPFKGTPEQFVQTRSENFKKAFPEGADVTYRGDNEHYPELRPRGDKFFGQPVFTANEKLAKYYTAKGNKAGFFSPNEATAFERLQTYLNENYPDLSIQEFMERYPNLARGAMATEQGGIHQLAIPRTKNILELDAKGKMWSSLDDPEMNKKIIESGIEKSVYNKDTEPYLFTTDDIAQYIKQQNIDRALIRNVDDGSIGTVLIHNQQPGKFAKSLRGNSGMFDMNDPNIYKALIPAIGVGALGAAGATKQEKKNGGWLNKYK